MMNCDKAKQLLSDYIDNTLEPEVKKEIDDFLESNSECKEIFADVLSLQNQLKSLSRVTPTSEFEINLRNKIIALNSNDVRQVSFNKKGLSLAFSGAVLITAVYMFVFTDFGIQQNISDEILPSSTITTSKPSPTVSKEQVNTDQENEQNPVTEADSLNNLPEKVDNAKIHFTGEGD
jgi:hypothetical protein